MFSRLTLASLLGTLPLLSVAPAIASADTLAVSCSGTPGASSITWTATTTGGVEPVAFLWDNGATASSQTVSYAAGLHSIGIQATDASSTIATSTCSATVAWPVPSIGSFVANPASIVSGASSVLSWTVSNASTTSISGLGDLTGTATTVAPTATTVYTLTATNPSGSVTATTTVFVTASTTGNTGGVAAQIQALLAQIRALQAQIAQLVAGAVGTGTGTTTPPVNGVRFCLDSDRNHGEGESGDDIRSIQQMLAADSSIYPEGIVSGFFGPLTKKALQRYQEKFGVTATGFFGPQTRALFKSHCGEGLTSFDNGSTTVAVPPGQVKKLEKETEDDHGSSSRNRGLGNSSDD